MKPAILALAAMALAGCGNTLNDCVRETVGGIDCVVCKNKPLNVARAVSCHWPALTAPETK